jgi:hypothetical protein
MADVYHSPGTGPNRDAADEVLGRMARLEEFLAAHDGLTDAQLDEDVTAERYDAAVLRLRAAREALREALGTQTTDEVLWEGETVRGNGGALAGPQSLANAPLLNVPPGTRVRVVRATDQPSEATDAVVSAFARIQAEHVRTWPSCNTAHDEPSEDDLLDAERIEGTVLDAVHKVDGTCELVIEVPEAEYGDYLGTHVAVLALVAADQPTEVADDG